MQAQASGYLAHVPSSQLFDVALNRVLDRQSAELRAAAEREMPAWENLWMERAGQLPIPGLES